MNLGKKQTLFVSVDALNSQDALTVGQQSTANIFEVYLNRNHNLPRYGLKREFRDEFSEPDESVRSLLEGSVSGQTAYAAHINMIDEFQEGAGHSTFDTGTGITIDQQIKTISEGMLQTYRSLINRWEGSQQEEELISKVRPLVYSMICVGRDKGTIVNLCKVYREKNGLTAFETSDTQLEVERAWLDLKKYINDSCLLYTSDAADE